MTSSLAFRYAIKTKKQLIKISCFFAYRVELEGIEPSSAQGNHTLSTCLFRTKYSGISKNRTTNRYLIP